MFASWSHAYANMTNR